MSELQKRIAFGLPAAILFVALTWVGGWPFWGFLLLISIAVQFELDNITRSAGSPANKVVAFAIAIWVMLSPFIEEPLVFGIALFLILIVAELFSKSPDSISHLLITLFNGLYAPLGFLALYTLRTYTNSSIDLTLALSLCFMVWGNDVLAYFGGRAFGKHKMAPSISPKKSWEGFAFGFIGAFVGYGIVSLMVSEDALLKWPIIISMAIVVSFFGPIGDLTASKLKRAANVKDSSTLLPGHGGFYDRFDALIIAAPAVLVLLKLLERFGYVIL